MAARTTALTFDKRGLGRAHRISAAYQWHPVTVLYSAASIMPVLSHAACGCYSGSGRGSMLLRVTSINCSGLGT